MAWHRINGGEGAYTYAHRTLVNCYLAVKRKGKHTEFRRADGVSVMVQASNYVPGPASFPPLTMAKVVTAAADPRWSWTMDSAFVANAQQVRLTAPAPRVCAQVQPADPRCLASAQAGQFRK